MYPAWWSIAANAWEYRAYLTYKSSPITGDALTYPSSAEENVYRIYRRIRAISARYREPSIPSRARRAIGAAD